MDELKVGDEVVVLDENFLETGQVKTITGLKDGMAKLGNDVHHIYCPLHFLKKLTEEEALKRRRQRLMEAEESFLARLHRSSNVEYKKIEI